MSAGPLSDDDIANLALEQEMTGEDTQTITKRCFQENAHAAAKSIVNLAIHSPNEKTRLQAAIYVTERVLGRIQDDPPKAISDPFASLWKEITSGPDHDPNELVRNTVGPIEANAIEAPELEDGK